MECLDNIIGISRTECECLAADISADDQVSISGIYLDEVEGGLKMTALEKIDCQTFVDKAKQAIKRAKDMFIEQIIAAYQTTDSRKAYEDFSGRIGKTAHLKTLTGLKQFAGLKLALNPIRGAKLVIKQIGLIISREQDVEVSILKFTDDSAELVDTITIPTIANMRSVYSFDKALELPFTSSSGEAHEYFVVYNTITHGNPRDNKAGCNCGRMDRILRSYLKAEGVSSSDIEALPLAKGSDNANGFFLDAEIACVTKSMVCNILKLDDSNTVAHAIAYKSQELLIEDLLSSPNINRFTMMSKEHLYGTRNHFRKEFEDRIVWLSQTKPLAQVSDCIVCHDNRIMKTLIR
ncbi:hypothetical protein [Sphingobacterium sp. LRF_L2]|uniref:hypothetical protein n=1 Tax=Sphingobacterium sp. LRF_L2 TaxID=3369421 RepID=UPI003F5E8D7E